MLSSHVSKEKVDKMFSENCQQGNLEINELLLHGEYVWFNQLINLNWWMGGDKFDPNFFHRFLEVYRNKTLQIFTIM